MEGRAVGKGYTYKGKKGPDHTGSLSQGKDSGFYPKCNKVVEEIHIYILKRSIIFFNLQIN